jgi:hypothetical protein
MSDTIAPTADWPGLEEFCAEHLAREPALQFAQRFSKNKQWLQRVVIIEELLECLFALSHIDLARAKLAWWVAEAELAKAQVSPDRRHDQLVSPDRRHDQLVSPDRRHDKQAARHPLMQGLQHCAGSVDAIATIARAGLNWVELDGAVDAKAQLEQLSEFAHGAAKLMTETDTQSVWQHLALKRQLQWHELPDRYGPSWASRNDLAQFQLKSTQLADKQLSRPLLQSRLSEIAIALGQRTPQRKDQSPATRAFASLHAAEARAWATNLEFYPTPVRPIALIRAWWRTVH